MCNRKVTDLIPIEDEGPMCARCYDHHLDKKFAMDAFPLNITY